MDKENIVFISVFLAREWHKGQVDKAGKDYFESHLLRVGKSGSTWQEKVVGYLHDAAEDTGHSVSEIIAELKRLMTDEQMLQEISDWHKRFGNVPSPYTEEPLTEADWMEIEEALNLMNHHTAPSREEYIKRFKGHPLAIKVKLTDLRSNMDLSRIPNPTEEDYKRVERYKKEYQQLTEYLPLEGKIKYFDTFLDF